MSQAGQIRRLELSEEHQVWQMAAESVGRRILTAFDVNAIDGSQVKPTTPIFVDRHLAGDLRGEDVLRRLHERGFMNLYLATGDELTVDEKEEIPFVKGVIGKRVPPQVYGDV